MDNIPCCWSLFGKIPKGIFLVILALRLDDRHF